MLLTMLLSTTKKKKKWKVGSLSDRILLPCVDVADGFPGNTESWEAKFLGMRLAEFLPLCGYCVKDKTGQVEPWYPIPEGVCSSSQQHEQ